MKVAIIRNTNNTPVGLWWHYNEDRKGCIELIRAYESTILNDSVLDAKRALNVEYVRATFEPGVLAEMISRPACFVDFVEIDQRLQVIS